MANNPYGYSIHPNLLRDYVSAEPGPTLPTAMPTSEDGTTPFPPQTPPGMAFVPYQQWEEPYDVDTAFPIGTIYPALDYPFRGGGAYV